MYRYWPNYNYLINQELKLHFFRPSLSQPATVSTLLLPISSQSSPFSVSPAKAQPETLYTVTYSRVQKSFGTGSPSCAAKSALLATSILFSAVPAKTVFPAFAVTMFVFDLFKGSFFQSCSPPNLPEHFRSLKNPTFVIVVQNLQASFRYWKQYLVSRVPVLF